jgi:hypothetical protein
MEPGLPNQVYLTRDVATDHNYYTGFERLLRGVIRPGIKKPAQPGGQVICLFASM